MDCMKQFLYLAAFVYALVCLHLMNANTSRSSPKYRLFPSWNISMPTKNHGNGCQLFFYFFICFMTLSKVNIKKTLRPLESCGSAPQP